MSRTANSYYTDVGINYELVSGPDEKFKKEDLQYLQAAHHAHDHDVNWGKPVARLSGAAKIQDSAANNYYVLSVADLGADRTISLPLLAANDTFVFAAHTQTLTSKTLTSPTIDTPTITSPSMTSPTITSGGLVITAGNVTMTNGNLLLSSGGIIMSTAASTLRPGATSFAVRNNADSADNLLITNAGVATIRAGLVVTTGGINATGNSTITGTLGGLTGVTTSGGLVVSTGGAAITGNSTITGTLGGLTGLTVASGGITVSGGVVISTGGLSVSAGGATITNTQNASTQVEVVNESTGASALSGIALNGNPSTLLVASLSSGYGAPYTSKGLIQSNAAAGLMIQNNNSGPIQFYVGASGTTLAWYVDDGGALVQGANTGTSGTINLKNTGSIYGRNAANSADIHMISLNGSNEVVLAAAGTYTRIAGPVIVAGASIEIGGTPATAGEVRLPNVGTIRARNAANTLNVILLYLTGTNEIQIGDGNNAGVLINHGTSFMRLTSNGGVTLGNPTGMDKGAGTLNANAVYDDNVLLTDAVFDLYHDGKLRPEDEENPRWKALRLWGLPEVEAFAREHRHLPWLPGRKTWEADGSRSTGAMITHLWETVEHQSLFLFDHESRVATLEARIKELESRLAA
jgi:lipopolysaccharide export system protein LptA